MKTRNRFQTKQSMKMRQAEFNADQTLRNFKRSTSPTRDFDQLPQLNHKRKLK